MGSREGVRTGVARLFPFASPRTMLPHKEHGDPAANLATSVASAHDVVLLEEGALRRWLNGDPRGFLELCAEDVVYFDPFQERRIDGLVALTAYYESLRGKIRAERFELLNPLVQEDGNAATLTFNFVSFDAKETPTRWNCTEVYRRRGRRGGSSRRTGRSPTAVGDGPRPDSRGMQWRRLMSTLQGGCHCGNITVEFETVMDPGTLRLRACQCSFCRKHGARNASDPAGLLTVAVRDATTLLRYRFGLGVTDFLVCKGCGVYVAATTVSGSGVIGTVNVNVLDDQESLPSTAEPMRYEGEGVEERMARRARAWTPARLLV